MKKPILIILGMLISFVGFAQTLVYIDPSSVNPTEDGTKTNPYHSYANIGATPTLLESNTTYLWKREYPSIQFTPDVDYTVILTCYKLVNGVEIQDTYTRTLDGDIECPECPPQTVIDSTIKVYFKNIKL